MHGLANSNSGMINRFMISLKPNRIGNLVSVSDCVIHASDFLCDDWSRGEKTCLKDFQPLNCLDLPIKKIYRLLRLK